MPGYFVTSPQRWRQQNCLKHGKTSSLNHYQEGKKFWSICHKNRMCTILFEAVHAIMIIGERCTFLVCPVCIATWRLVKYIHMTLTPFVHWHCCDVMQLILIFAVLLDYTKRMIITVVHVISYAGLYCWTVTLCSHHTEKIPTLVAEVGGEEAWSCFHPSVGNCNTLTVHQY
jgi:hypothetical protein